MEEKLLEEKFLNLLMWFALMQKNHDDRLIKYLEDELKLLKEREAIDD